MNLPLQITFRDMNHSDAIATHVERRAGKLDMFFDRITACHVVVEAPPRQHPHARSCHVRVDIAVPGNDIIVDCSPSDHPRHQSLHAVVDDAFDDVERRLTEYARKKRVSRRETRQPM